MNNEKKNKTKSPWKQVADIKDLKRGQIIRHVSGGKSYVVDANYGSHVTAMTSMDITNAIEWEVLKSE